MGSVDGDIAYITKNQDAFDGGSETDQIPSVGYHIPNSPYVSTWCFPPDLRTSRDI
jgi:hypothetical protein